MRKNQVALAPPCALNFQESTVSKRKQPIGARGVSRAVSSLFMHTLLSSPPPCMLLVKLIIFSAELQCKHNTAEQESSVFVCLVILFQKAKS